jgi:hypothetical protein
MATLAKFLFFLFGMSIRVQLIAALYGFIDLWYTIRTTYFTVVQRILIWSVISVATFWILPDFLRPSFLWGMIGYVFLYVIIYKFYHLLFARNTKSLLTK